jgi:hypothetical protein
MNTSKTVNFRELVRLNNTDFSLNIQDKLVAKLYENFKDEEQRWFAANMYMYMKFHPTDDFPINLEDVYSMIGFANKENAKKNIEK